ncbi:MAG: putative rane protein [Haloplasmataceae bacterium]|jgi:putative Mn2+ efflux pump MntP|nr:putative rane protein [Haloplasmataceae bacterium]
MEIITIVMLSIALAMDAFAVAISLGMSGLARNISNRLKIAFTFGIFQAGLFTLGYLSISLFGHKYTAFNSYIAAALLAILGIKMIKEVYSEDANNCHHNVCLGLDCNKRKCDRTGQYRYLTSKLLLIFGIATSIDAFAAGVSYRLTNDNSQTLTSSLSIGLITLVLAYIGASIGFKIKNKIGKYANLFGGIILLILAIKSLF